ncbi:MAG: aldehyde dehydrogenase [Betaproteobacteria bacterium RIFCSPLOWO2_12_FULL_65_14]|nr:MAG: aldehyde dehydrogenase [Betaproteobacteria bacterium RIFCSPLOWO2_12_FULL_65_14]
MRQRTISPVDGSLYVERDLASGEAIEDCLDRAVAAQRSWRRVAVAERAALCRRMAEWCVARADELGKELSWQMGRPVSQSPGELRRGFHERAHYMCGVAEEALSDIRIAEKEGFERFIRREPHGVVLVLAPWNYPWLTSVNAVVPALLAGNSVILKMAQQTPLVAERYAQAFAAAGLPDGVFQFVHVDHAAAARMIGDRRVGYVAFTGSVGGGHAVQRAAAGRFIGSGLELGGKDPAYVRADAPLAPTLENLVDGVYFNSGQSCCAVERIYVHKNLHEKFVEAFVDLARQYRLGNPLERETNLGPLVRAEAADAVRAQIQEALDKGAKALLPVNEEKGSPYLPPQVLVDVNHGMAVMTEETFGPVVGIQPVQDDEEAIRLMNDSRYGLTASIWTADAAAALAIGERVETGTWFMNRCDYLDPALAWTGVKDSGRGCTLSRLGLESFTRPKSFHLRLSL